MSQNDAKMSQDDAKRQPEKKNYIYKLPINRFRGPILMMMMMIMMMMMMVMIIIMIMTHYHDHCY